MAEVWPFADFSDAFGGSKQNHVENMGRSDSAPNPQGARLVKRSDVGERLHGHDKRLVDWLMKSCLGHLPHDLLAANDAAPPVQPQFEGPRRGSGASG